MVVSMLFSVISIYLSMPGCSPCIIGHERGFRAYIQGLGFEIYRVYTLFV